jgi:hypothetical protein
VSIGSGVTSIGFGVFLGCFALTSISFQGMVAPTQVHDEWQVGTSEAIRGHAYAASNFPAPGGEFYGLIMGDHIPEVPGAPTLSSATGDTYRVTLVWTAPAGTITGYKVFYGTTSTPTMQFGGTLDASTLTVDVTGLTSGTLYYFAVKAVNADGDSVLSNVLSALVGDYIYAVGGTPSVATITGYRGAGGAITIPSTLGGYPVVAIGVDAFHSQASLTSVVIPYGVISIGQSAFQSCTALTSVTIPGSVTGIGYCAFIFCSSLTSAAIPSSVTSIGEGAFCDTALTSVTIPNGVTSIGGWMFDHCEFLTSVTIPDSVTSIGESAFRSCASLTSVTIPNGVTSIGLQAFSRCNALTSVNIPSGVTSISDNTFSYCSSLTSVTIPSGVTSIDHHAFSSCTALTSMNFMGLSKPTYLGYGWTFGCAANLRGHAYAASNFPAPGGSFNGLIMGDYIVEAPGAPTVQSAIERNGQATLTWAAPSSGGIATGYKVFYGTTATPTTQFGGTLSASTLTVDVTGLTPGVVYYFGVKAVNAGGDSPLSNVLVGTVQYQLTTSANYGSVTPDDGTWYNAGTVVAISAIAPSAGAGESYVWNGWTGTGLGSYSGTTNAASITMNGPISETAAWVRVTTPEAVTEIVAIAGEAQVILSWSPPSGSPVDLYTVFIDDVETTQVAATNVKVENLVNGRTYSFRVVAHNAAGNGPSSPAVSATPVLGGNSLQVRITSPANDSYHNGSVLVQWSVNGDALLQSTEMRTNESSWTAVPGMSVTLTGLAEGRNIIYVRATDVKDRVYTASVNVTVDTIAPIVLSSSPNGTKESTRVVVNITFSKAMDPSATSITIGGISGNVTWNGTTATFTPDKTLIGDTQYNVTVTGQDLFGNQLAATNWTFRTAKVGTVSGAINPLKPDSTIVLKSNNIYFKKPIVIINLELYAERVKGPSTLFAAEASHWERTTLTDEHGCFVFYDVPLGRYEVKTTDSSFEPTSMIISMTAADMARGGVSMSMTANPIDNTPLYVGIILIMAVVVVLLLLVVRRRKKQAAAKGKQETPAEKSENGRQVKK